MSQLESEMNKTVYIEHKVNNVLSNAFSVVLSDQNGTFGIRSADGNILVPANTAVDNPSTGVYQYTTDFLTNVIYVVSWKIITNDGDAPQYVQQEIGPFTEISSTIRAVADSRGEFKQGASVVLFLRVTDLDGNAQNASSITVGINGPSGDIVNTATTPELVQTGFYAYDWTIPETASVGEYYITWTYTVNGATQVVIQSIIVSADPDLTNINSLYGGKQAINRQALTNLILPIQSIPVYKEPAKPSRDRKNYDFTWPRWNQSSGVRIYRNDIIINENITVDYFKGKVAFDVTQTEYDRIEASYNFRYFSDEQLDTFLNNAVQMYNIYPPVTYYGLPLISTMWVPTILYGAAVDAIRAFLLAIQFPEIQLILGNVEAASRVFSNLESLKKNYEDTWNKALEQKKLGPYVGLTRFVSTPEFALPGGRSRWFRYLFSSGSGS